MVKEIPWEEKYTVWFILVDTSVFKIHDWEIWKAYYLALDPMLSKLNPQTEIRTFQTHKWIWWWLPFGKMHWNRENNIKWTSKFKKGWRKRKSLEFFNTEVLSPDYYSCEKSKTFPKVYLRIDEGLNEYWKQPYNASILIAIKQRSVDKNWSLLVEELFKIKTSIALVEGEKYWGKKWNQGEGYCDAIPYLHVYAILNREKQFVVNENLDFNWKIRKNKNEV